MVGAGSAGHLRRKLWVVIEHDAADTAGPVLALQAGRFRLRLLHRFAGVALEHQRAVGVDLSVVAARLAVLAHDHVDRRGFGLRCHVRTSPASPAAAGCSVPIGPPTGLAYGGSVARAGAPTVPRPAALSHASGSMPSRP